MDIGVVIKKYRKEAGITASFVTVQNHPDYLFHIHSIERLID